MDTFWDRVDRLLEKHRVKRPWLAKKTAQGLNTMQKRIQNGVVPRVDEAAQIAAALGVTIDYLQTGVTNASMDESEDVASVCEAVRTMQEQDLMRLQGWLSAHGYQTWTPAPSKLKKRASFVTKKGQVEAQEPSKVTQAPTTAKDEAKKVLPRKGS